MLKTQIRDINTGKILAERDTPRNTGKSWGQRHTFRQWFASRVFNEDTSEHPHFVYWVMVDAKNYAIHRGTF